MTRRELYSSSKSNSGKESVDTIAESQLPQCTLSLRNASYPGLNVDLPTNPRILTNFLGDPDVSTYQSLMRHQENRGYPTDGLYVAMQRKKREARRWPVAKLEEVLFDWTTTYGTAAFPPSGLLIYAAGVMLCFTTLYVRAWKRDVRIASHYLPDGELDPANPHPPLGKVFWLSIDAFVPAVSFFNVSNWKWNESSTLKIGCVRLSYATVAMIQRLCGWAIVPTLLHYLFVAPK